MKINLKSPGWNPSVIETEQHTIIQEAFCGPIFVTKDGACLAVMMRDDGYELSCWRENDGHIPGPYEVLPNDAIMFSVDPHRGVEVQTHGSEIDVEDIEGSWFVYAYDSGPYPIAMFDNELSALRHVNQLGYGNVLFWPSGLTWDDAVALTRKNHP